jgi:DNA (cytosine-5)-methyltransferase 1
MKAISLFSGCGGMDFGAEKAGVEIIFASELIPEYCNTLRKYFPNTEIVEGDIENIKDFPEADLVIGGYPCQSFSMGGNRDPKKDKRTYLYQHYARCLELVQPMYFIAENVDGLQKLQGGAFLKEQISTFENAGKFGYYITYKVLDAKEYGVPQSRKRMLIVGVRKDIGRAFIFPDPTHGRPTKKYPNLIPFASHGEAIKDLPLWPTGEFYERPHDPEGHFSWYYMSRNRKANWDNPSYTIVANWRHITLHPASPIMKLTWSDLSNGWKQRWDFSNEYEHIIKHPELPILEQPRRLSWRECARIQTFRDGFEPEGKADSKFTQIGNAVPPLLAEVIIRHLISGKGLASIEKLKYSKQDRVSFNNIK